MLDEFKFFVRGKINSVMDRANTRHHWYAFHTQHNHETYRLLKSIESEKGKTDPKFAKLSAEYARDVFGWVGYAPWLVVYSAMAGEFKEGWIPDNYYGWTVVPKVSGPFGTVTDAKTLSRKLLSTDRLPDVAYHMNGLFYDTSWNAIPPESLAEHIFDSESRIVYKADNSCRGHGVRVLTKETFDIGKIIGDGGGVFQKFVAQHAFFDEIMPDSGATLRLTTVIDDNGKASCRAAFMRFGRKADTHVKWDSSVKIAVDLATGKLFPKGFLSDWRSVESHPDTGFVFAGKTLPEFGKCVGFALETHQSSPYFRSIGWDMIVDADGEIQLFEWNGAHNDIKFSEAAHGPCFADLGWEKLWRR